MHDEAVELALPEATWAAAELMAVMLVLPWAPECAGGVSIVVKALARQFLSHSVRTSVLVSEWEARRPHGAVDGTVRFRFALVPATGPLGLLKAAVTAPARLWRTWALLRRDKITAVNFHYPGLDALGVAVLKLFGLFRGRLLLSFHGTDARAPEGWVQRSLWRLLLSQTDGVTACSQSLATQVAKALSLPAHRVTVLYNGVDAEQFAPGLPRGAEECPPLPARYIVSVGSFIPRKAHRLLLEAFGELAADHPDVSLVIVGMDGQERQPLLQRAAAMGLADRLVCLTNQSQDHVAEIVSNAALSVQPSHAEPFGLAVIEAAACGVPIVASAVGGHLEILQDGKTALLFPAGDAATCSRQMRRLLEDPALANAMADRARSITVTRFGWPSCATGYMSLMLPASGARAQHA